MQWLEQGQAPLKKPRRPQSLSPLTLTMMTVLSTLGQAILTPVLLHQVLLHRRNAWTISSSLRQHMAWHLAHWPLSSSFVVPPMMQVSLSLMMVDINLWTHSASRIPGPRRRPQMLPLVPQLW